MVIGVNVKAVMIRNLSLEYYAAIKRNEILPFAMTWMELEGITVSEISQSKKDNYYMISLILGI